MQDRAPTCQLQPPTSSRLSCFRVAHASAPLRWLSVWVKRSTRACDARAPCRADCNRSIPYARVLHQREASILRCNTVLQRASCSLQRTAGFRVAHASAPLRWLSVGRRRRTRACNYRGRFMLYERILHWRDASLPRCKTVRRCASCGLQRAAGFHVAHASAPLRWLSVGRSRSTRVYGACAPCRAGCDRFIPCGKALHQQKKLSYSVKPCSDVPAAASNEQPTLARGVRKRATALAVYGEEAQHARLRRARAVPR